MSFHPTSRDWGTFPLRELVEEVCRPLASRLRAQAIQTEIDIPPSQTVTADRELLRRAVRNLVLNAVDAMPEGGLLTATSAAGPRAVELEIADTGAALRTRSGNRPSSCSLRPSAAGPDGDWPWCTASRKCMAAALRPRTARKAAWPSPCGSPTRPPWRPPHNV